MKKLLTLFTALLCFGSAMNVLAVDYYVAGTMNGWNTTSNENKMSLVSGTTYSKTFSAMGATSYEFKISTYNWGSDWGSGNMDNSQSNVTLSNKDGNIKFTLTTTSDVTFYFNSGTQKVYVQATPVVVPSYTFPNGTTIYYDFTAYDGGVNVCINGGEPWHENTSAIFSETLSSAWEVTATTNLFKSAPPSNSWTYKTCSTLPTEGQNMLVGDADGIGCHWDTYIPDPPAIKMHGNFLGSWNNTNAFVVAGNKETASLTLNIPAKGTKEFGMRIGSDDNWTSNGASITRASTSAAIVSGSGNCSLNADIPGEYTFTWTYATNTLSVTYPELPEQFVAFDGLSSEILKGTNITFAATSTGITNPVYSFYVKPAGGEYGSAVSSYTFDTDGSFTVKVSAEGDNTASPVVEELNVSVYSTYTFTAGTRIYVDFTAMTEGSKKVNYPNNNAASLAYDENGAGTFKTIRFENNVTWSTLNDFIKTEKAGWDPGMKFTVPADGQNKIIVAADGASYTWGTYTPATVQVKFFAPRDESSNWDHVYAHSWDAAGDITSWPGVEITDSKANLWYAYDVQVGANVLFHNGNGMQTANIENIQAAACYEPTAIDYESTPKIVTVTANAGCEIAYYIAGVKELVGGTNDWQINLPLDEENKIVFQDVEPGTYAFKINNNSWAWSIGGIDHMKAGDCASIAQEVGVGDLGFKIDTKQDVTVTYYPATQEICLGAVTVKATGTADAADMNIKSGESKKITYTTNNTENPNVTYTVLSGSEYIGLFQGVITGIKAGTATVRVSLAETANYTAASDEFTIMISNPVAPAEAIAPVGGKFIINAKGDTAVFSRGNLKYNVATGEWYCADHQYDFVGEGGNLHFGDANYAGEYDLFGWSCTASNYGLMQSNHDDVYTGEFVDWGGLFAGGEQEWVTPTGNELYYIINHHQWTIMALDPTPEDADNEDEIYGLAIFPIGWVQPAGFDDLTYSYSNWWDEETIAKNTFALSKWSDLEAAGAVFLPHAGARAGHWGNDWNGKATVSTKNPNPNGGNSYCFVDNIGWFGYYWSSITDPRSEHPYDAQYLITPGWSEGPTDADEDDLYIQPQVWSREKRRGNSVRLVTRIPRRYTVTYDAGGAAGTVPVDDNTYLPGDNVVLGAQGDLAKDGFTFAGWNDGNATYDAGADYTMPEKDVTLTAQWNSVYTTVRTGLETNRYYTVCLPRSVTDATGATFWNLQYRNSGNTEVYLEGVDLPLEAGKPYIFQATAENLQVLYEGDAVGSPVANGALRGTFVDIDADAFALLSGDVYLLINNAIRPRTTGNFLNANRAYILYNELDPLPAAGFAPGKRVRAIPMQGQTATGMDNVQGDDVQCTKVLIDGQLYILRANRMYDVTGKLVK